METNSNFEKAKPSHLLVIEDNEGDYILITEYLSEVLPTTRVQWCSTFAETAAYFLTEEAKHIDVILLDLILPDKSSDDLLTSVIDLSGDTIPIIILTGLNDINKSVKSLTLGASDYLIKDELSPAILNKSILYSRERKKAFETIKEMHNQSNQRLEEERKRIGREIHDELGQHLVRLKMDLFAIKHRFTSIDPEISTSIESSIEMVNDLVYIVKRIVSDLRPPLLDEFGLLTAMESYLNTLNEKSVPTIMFDFEYKEIHFEDSWSIDVYRVMQEAVNNAIKHAEAELITVSCAFKENKHFELKVEDNGNGSFTTQISTNRWGIIGMKERASRWTGSLKIESEPQKGTCVTLLLPIATSNQLGL